MCTISVHYLPSFSINLHLACTVIVLLIVTKQPNGPGDLLLVQNIHSRELFPLFMHLDGHSEIQEKRRQMYRVLDIYVLDGINYDLIHKNKGLNWTVFLLSRNTNLSTTYRSLHSILGLLSP